MHLTTSVCCSVYGGSDLLSASCLGAKVVPVQSENRLPPRGNRVARMRHCSGEKRLFGDVLLLLLVSGIVGPMQSNQKRAIPH